MPTQEPVQGERPEDPSGIVSVNSRGGSGGGAAGKLLFLSGVVGLMVVAGFYAYNKYRAARDEQAAKTHQTATNDSKPAQVGFKRDFEKEQAAAVPPPLPGGATTPADGATGGGPSCADGQPGTIMIGPDNKPMATASGVALRVCSDGRVIVPDIEGAGPIGVVSNQPAGAPKPSRYGGDVIASGGNTPALSPPGAGPLTPTDPAQAAAMVSNLLAQGRSNGGVNAASPATAAASSPPGSVGSQLTPSVTPLVTASMLGDRNMILPKGRSIDCGLSMRVVNDVPGLASCVLSQNVYSDNGKVVLLERGSEAVGEYGASMAQGQKRLFVIWTRIKTPNGVVINLNSPGADDLGTSGLPGFVNNHWFERIGAAFLLSIVEDAIAFKTAQATGGGGGSGVAVYQNTSQTGDQMASKILDSTINIKPTLYKNQGDRSTIYVARDLDFSSIYALRPR